MDFILPPQRQCSSGGETKLGQISKRGDVYFRTMLIHGARAVLGTTSRKGDRKSRWAESMREGRGNNVAAVGLAAKHARMSSGQNLQVHTKTEYMRAIRPSFPNTEIPLANRGESIYKRSHYCLYIRPFIQSAHSACGGGGGFLGRSDLFDFLNRIGHLFPNLPWSPFGLL